MTAAPGLRREMRQNAAFAFTIFTTCLVFAITLLSLDALGLGLDPHVPAVVPMSLRDLHAKRAGGPRCSPPAIQGSSWVVKSLEAALWAFHRAASFEEAVLAAVNLGDDADTTGAICGQLAGAYWGESQIPESWRHGIVRRDLLERALARILGTASPPA